MRRSDTKVVGKNFIKPPLMSSYPSLTEVTDPLCLTVSSLLEWRETTIGTVTESKFQFSVSVLLVFIFPLVSKVSGILIIILKRVKKYSSTSIKDDGFSDVINKIHKHTTDN